MAKRVKQSAGLLMFRKPKRDYEVFLVHPGGPYWAKKDKGAWTVPKGEYEDLLPQPSSFVRNSNRSLNG